MDPLSRSLDVTRTMLRGALWAFRQESLKGASESRIRSARDNLVFWRERYEVLLRAREGQRRTRAKENGLTPKQSTR